MPIYGYKCSRCGVEKEVLQHIRADVECCGVKMDLVFSPAMIKVKGEGGYPSRRKQVFNTTSRNHPNLEHEPNRVYI